MIKNFECLCRFTLLLPNHRFLQPLLIIALWRTCLLILKMVLGQLRRGRKRRSLVTLRCLLSINRSARGPISPMREMLKGNLRGRAGNLFCDPELQPEPQLRFWLHSSAKNSSTCCCSGLPALPVLAVLCCLFGQHRSTSSGIFFGMASGNVHWAVTGTLFWGTVLVQCLILVILL